MKYHAMTIDYYNGKTYWNKSKDKLKDVYEHLQRYCHRRCHVLIFKENKPNHGLEFVKRMRTIMGKGSKDRVKDKKSFNKNFDRIFGKRSATKGKKSKQK